MTQKLTRQKGQPKAGMTIIQAKSLFHGFLMQGLCAYGLSLSIDTHGLVIS
jgi:hypothetical protein